MACGGVGLRLRTPVWLVLKGGGEAALGSDVCTCRKRSLSACRVPAHRCEQMIPECAGVMRVRLGPWQGAHRQGLALLWGQGGLCQGRGDPRSSSEGHGKEGLAWRSQPGW